MRLAGALLLCGACGRFGFTPGDSAATADASDASDASAASYSEQVLAAGPRLYLRLSETMGLVARDASGHGEDAVYGTSGGTLLFQVPGALSTDLDPAVQIDGTGAMGASTELGAAGSTWSNDFTLEMFVRPLASPPNYDYFIFICETYMVNGFRFGWDAQNRLDLWTTEAGATGSFVAAETVQLNAWNHLVVVRQGPTWSMYRNGALAGSQTVDYMSAAVDASCGFGAFHGVSTHAAYDELAIYDRALTAGEVAAHAAAR